MKGKRKRKSTGGTVFKVEHLKDWLKTKGLEGNLKKDYHG
jgi:hypothetical protein